MVFFTTTLRAQSKSDTAAIQTIIQDQVISWNKGELVQVIVKEADGSKIVAYHNVDLKPGIPIPED